MADLIAPLAPALGRLAAPPAGTPWDPIRLDLVDALVEVHAAGRLDGAAWLAAWTTAATAVRDRVIAEARDRLRRAAVHSRLPERRLAELLPDQAAGERLLHRLLAEGMALEELESGGSDPERQRRRGGALEAAWEGAMRIAAVEAGRYRTMADRTMAWRRPWRPLVLIGTVAVLVASLVAAVIAGVIPAPAWFRPVVDWFWGLPWP